MGPSWNPISKLYKLLFPKWISPCIHPPTTLHTSQTTEATVKQVAEPILLNYELRLRSPRLAIEYFPPVDEAPPQNQERPLSLSTVYQQYRAGPGVVIRGHHVGTRIDAKVELQIEDYLNQLTEENAGFIQRIQTAPPEKLEDKKTGNDTLLYNIVQKFVLFSTMSYMASLSGKTVCETQLSEIVNRCMQDKTLSPLQEFFTSFQNQDMPIGWFYKILCKLVYLIGYQWIGLKVALAYSQNGFEKIREYLSGDSGITNRSEIIKRVLSQVKSLLTAHNNVYTYYKQEEAQGRLTGDLKKYTQERMKEVVLTDLALKNFQTEEEVHKRLAASALAHFSTRVPFRFFEGTLNSLIQYFIQNKIFPATSGVVHGSLHSLNSDAFFLAVTRTLISQIDTLNINLSSQDQNAPPAPKTLINIDASELKILVQHLLKAIDGPLNKKNEASAESQHNEALQNIQGGIEEGMIDAINYLLSYLTDKKHTEDLFFNFFQFMNHTFDQKQNPTAKDAIAQELIQAKQQLKERGSLLLNRLVARGVEKKLQPNRPGEVESRIQATFSLHKEKVENIAQDITRISERVQHAQNGELLELLNQFHQNSLALQEEMKTLYESVPAEEKPSLLDSLKSTSEKGKSVAREALSLLEKAQGYAAEDKMLTACQDLKEKLCNFKDQLRENGADKVPQLFIDEKAFKILFEKETDLHLEMQTILEGKADLITSSLGIQALNSLTTENRNPLKQAISYKERWLSFLYLWNLRTAEMQIESALEILAESQALSETDIANIHTISSQNLTQTVESLSQNLNEKTTSFDHQKDALLALIEEGISSLDIKITSYRDAASLIEAEIDEQKLSLNSAASDLELAAHSLFRQPVPELSSKDVASLAKDGVELGTLSIGGALGLGGLLLGAANPSSLLWGGAGYFLSAAAPLFVGKTFGEIGEDALDSLQPLLTSPEPVKFFLKKIVPMNILKSGLSSAKWGAASFLGSLVSGSAWPAVVFMASTYRGKEIAGSKVHEVSQNLEVIEQEAKRLTAQRVQTIFNNACQFFYQSPHVTNATIQLFVHELASLTSNPQHLPE